MNKKNKLKKLLNTIRNNWKIAVVAVVLTTISGYLLSAYGIEKHYITTFDVMITDEGGKPDPVSATTAALLFKSPNIYNEMNEGLQVRFSYQEYEKMIEISQEGGTGILRAEIDMSTAENSCKLAEIYLKAMPKVLSGYIENTGITVISAPKMPEAPVFPNDLLFIGIGFGAGLLISVIGILIIWKLDNTITSADNLTDEYNIPVLGELMDFDREIDYLGR